MVQHNENTEDDIFIPPIPEKGSEDPKQEENPIIPLKKPPMVDPRDPRVEDEYNERSSSSHEERPPDFDSNARKEGSFRKTAKIPLPNMEDITNLEDRDTTFVFLFGPKQEGKSAVTSCLIYYLGTTDVGELAPVRKGDNLNGKAYYKDIFRHLRSGKFIPRNSLNEVYEIDLSFSPIKKRLPEMKVTFLEMSGEDLAKVESNGTLPPNIDIFLDYPDLNLVFILVTSYQKARENDALMKEFVEYITEKNKDHKSANLLLLITKWDEYDQKYKDDVEEFVKHIMPQTHQSIYNREGTISSFSVGKVKKVGQGEEAEVKIMKLNLDFARSVSAWLYKTVTGSKLIVKPPKPWWERFMEILHIR